MKALIDADYTVYKNCAACETEIDYGNDVIVVSSLFSDAYKAVERDLSRIRKEFLEEVEIILFFSDSNNFRKKIDPAYKGHRNRKKPCGYKRVINELKNNYKVIIKPTLEADDALGIYATKFTGNVIVSPDKDMRQIPGQLYDLKEFTYITPEEGAKWHLVQSLAGDQTDGYSGCPGQGVKRATTLFEEKGYSWKTVVDAFKEKDLTEEDALMNARLARILTKDDYDFDKREPIRWTPTADYRVDDGAGPKIKTDT